MATEQVLGKGGEDALGVYNEFKIIDRVQGKLVFALEALRTLGKSSGWHDIESVSVQLFNDDETKGPRLTCRQARFNVETKDANLSGSVQVEFPDGAFLSTEVGALLDGGRRFESSTNVVFVGKGVLGSAGAATYEMRKGRLKLTKGVIIRTDAGNSMVAPELVYKKNDQKLGFPQGAVFTFGGFTVSAPKGEIVFEEGQKQPSKIRFEGGVTIEGHEPESGQNFECWSETLEARKDPAGRWRVTARTRGPWVRFMTVGGQDNAFQEIKAWEIRAVVGHDGLLNVKADGRVCLHVIPLEGPSHTAEGDSVRVWFDRGAATDMELLDDVVIAGDGNEATAHRARIDSESGQIMLYGNPTGAKRVVIESERGRISADQAVLFQQMGRIEIRGRVQGEMFEAGLIGNLEGGEDSSDRPVHLASGSLVVADESTTFELRDDARMWQGQQLLMADEIRYSSTRRVMEAKGHVKTELPAVAVDQEASPDSTIVVSSRSMIYDEIKGQAVYLGDVVYLDPKHRLEAGKIEVEIGQHGKVERVIATGAVKIVAAATEQTLTGNQAIRDTATGIIVLTGDPAKAFDSEGNMLSGRSLTWDQAGGRVTVSEETETIYHTEEEF
jgi:lipopolysaccharide transport protein LptA